MTKQKKRHQVKSQWYYWFWGIATVSVLLGQLYVGTGYRLMSGRFHDIMEMLEFEIEKDSYPGDRIYP